MSEQQSIPGRARARVAIATAAVAAVAFVATPAAGAATSGTDPDVGTLPAAAERVMDKRVYRTARWIYYVAEAKSGDVLLASRPDEMVFTASTGKNFTVGSAYATLGVDTTLTTPVYATGPVVAGTVDGDLALVASGDLALGGRGGLDGTFDHTFVGDTIDHVYANVAPNAEPTTAVGDPLAGLDELARQVAAKGVTHVDGDVVIDTRIWEPYEGQEGPVPPIYVNDNIVDLTVTAGAPGEPATIAMSPPNGMFTVVADVRSVPKGDETALAVDADPADPSKIVVSGTIEQGKSQVTIYRVPDAATWARTLFVEALGRAGVTVAAPAVGPNDEGGLPPRDGYGADQELASIESPPISAMGAMILEVSYNTGANAFLCLLAVDAGSTDCNDGLQTMDDLVVEAGLDPKAVFLIDGQGADPASTTPRQISKWSRWARTQPWGKAFVAGQPVLGKTGSLAPYGRKSSAKGKVAAKAGTSVAIDPVSGRLYSKVQSLAGYMTLDDGTKVVFGLSMSGATFANPYDGLVEAGTDVAAVAAAFQQSLSR